MNGRVDYSTFARRWASVPLDDLFAPKSDDVDAVTAAYDQFKALYHRHAIALNSTNYVTLALLLNRKLEYLLCLSANRQMMPQFREIEAEIHFFVRLVSEAGLSLQTTKDEVAQTIINCLLYYRIGDYHMALFKHTKDSESTTEAGSSRNVLVALGAYAFALNCLNAGDGSAADDNEQTAGANSTVGSIRTLLAAELSKLIERNLEFPNVADEFERLCRDEMLSFRLLYADDCRARAEYDNWVSACGPSEGKRSGNFIVDNVRMQSKAVGVVQSLLKRWHLAGPAFGHDDVTLRPRLLRRLVLVVSRDRVAMRRLLNALFREADFLDVPPSVDVRGRRDDSVAGTDKITRSVVKRLFRLLARNCSLVWYNNSVHTRDLEPPLGSALDERLAAVMFPYLLHRDVRPSDECVWASIQRVAAGMKLSQNEHRILTEYLAKLSADWCDESASADEENSHETVAYSKLPNQDHEETTAKDETVVQQKNQASDVDVCGSYDGNNSYKIVYEPLSSDSSCSSTIEYAASPEREQENLSTNEPEPPSDYETEDSEKKEAQISLISTLPITLDEEYEEETELILQYCSDVEAFSLQFDCIT